MPRYLIIAAALFAISCGKSDPLKEILPVQVQRAWTLEETRAIPNEEVADSIRRAGLKRALYAGYRGNGRIRVRVFDMGNDASALEVLQRWPPSDGLAFYKGHYFVLGEANDVDRTTLSSFLQALQQDLK
ncbi:MAG: hypothetical protein ABJF23_15570 [Bryobacteraceae bacterium]